MKKTLQENWEFLKEHKIFNVETRCLKKDLPEALQSVLQAKEIISRVSYFERGLSVIPVMVNPLSDIIESDSKRNTKQQIWLEVSVPFLMDGEIELSRDIELNAEGETFEDAIDKLAKRVKSLHGDDKKSSAFLI